MAGSFRYERRGLVGRKVIGELLHSPIQVFACYFYWVYFIIFIIKFILISIVSYIMHMPCQNK